MIFGSLEKKEKLALLKSELLLTDRKIEKLQEDRKRIIKETFRVIKEND